MTKTGILEVKKGLAEKLVKAAEEAIKTGKLPLIDLPEVFMERPQNPGHGDYASGLSLKLAKPVKSKPMTIAEDIIGLIESGDEIESIVVAPPGFINFKLSDKWLASQVDEILTAGEEYGNINTGNNSRI